MKIQFASDLHLEHRDPAATREAVSVTDADLIVLAGDIAEGLDGIRLAASLAAERAVPAVYVLGNHEYYHHRFPNLAERCRQMAARLRDSDQGEVHVLERGQLTISDVRLLGATLWTDYRLGTDGGAEAVAHNRRIAAGILADHRFIAADGGLFTPEDAATAHEADRHWLDETLARPWAGKTVVVTHHAPLPHLAHPAFPANGLASAFASDLEALIRRHEIDLWISGHTHANADLHLHGTRFVANQPGYPKETPASIRGAVFDAGKVVEV